MRKQGTLKQVLCLLLAAILLISPILSVDVSAETTGKATQSDWERIQEIVSQYYGEWTEPEFSGAISDHIPTTALLGNGDVGITSSGSDAIKEFLISKGDFWTYNGNPITVGGVTIGKVETSSDAESSDKGINLAPFAAEVTTSSAVDATVWEQYDWQGKYAVDGLDNADTANCTGYWVSQEANSDAEGNKTFATQGFWLQLRYNTPVTIGEYVLYNISSIAGDRYNDTRDWQLQVSDDGQTWETVSTVTDNTASVRTVKLATPVTTQYVRLFITKATQADSGTDTVKARIVELELYAGSAKMNLAPYASKVTHSDTNDTDSKQIDGAAATDGVKETAVVGTSGYWSTDAADVHWLELEYAEPITFGEYVLYNFSTISPTSAHLNTKAWEVQISDDGVTWETVSTVTDNTEAVRTVKLSEQVTTKYVRLYITQAVQGGDNKVRLVEFELYPGVVNPNLALGATKVTHSDTNDTGSTQIDGAAATDGVKETAVVGTSGYWSTDAADVHWLELEYAEPITFGEYVLYNIGYVNTGLAHYNTKAWEVQVSDDGQNWKTISTVASNTDAVCTVTLPQQVTTKYVRLYITQAVQSGDNKVRLVEFELYAGTPIANLAPAAAEVITSSSYGNMTGYGATDGSLNAVVGQSGYWTSMGLADGQTEHWLQLNYDAPVTIGEYVLYNFSHISSGSPNLNTNSWELQVSDDGETWETVSTVTDNTLAIRTVQLDTPVTTKYVRLYITKATQNDNSKVRLVEFELYRGTALDEMPLEEHFYEKQDILNAEIQTEQTLFGMATEMITWLAADRNLMVTEIKAAADATEAAEFTVTTWVPKNENGTNPITATHGAASVTVTRSTENKNPEDADAHVSVVAMSTKIVGATAVATSNATEGTGTLTFSVNPGDTVYIVTAIGGGGRTYKADGTTLFTAVTKEPVAEAAEILATVTDAEDIAEVNSIRKDWWKNFWCTSYVDLETTPGDDLDTIQKYYYGSQYLLGSSTTVGGVAAGLYGIWHTTDNAQWGSDYHMNYNFITTYFGSYSSGRADLTLDAIQALLDYMPRGEANAADTDEVRKITIRTGDYEYDDSDLNYSPDFVDNKIAEGLIDAENGIEGALLYPVGIAPWGMRWDDQHLYLCQLLCAAYNSWLITEYYEYTMDKDFLTSGEEGYTPYDFLKKSVALYEAWLVKEDSTENEDGYEYVIYSGRSEETWAKNAAVELASLKNALSHLIEYSELLGRDEAKRADWIEIYEHLPAQPTMEVDGKTVLVPAELYYQDLNAAGETDGIIQWEALYNAHTVPACAIFPGSVYNYFSSPEDIQLLHDTFDRFSDRGDGWWYDKNSNPKLTSGAAKIGWNLERNVEKFADVVNKTMEENFYVNDGTHGIEKTGGIEMVNSMMLNGDDGFVKVFPYWYADKDASFVNLRAKGAFAVSASYDGDTQEVGTVTVTSEAGTDMTFVVPWAEGATVTDSSGNLITTVRGTVPGRDDEKTITFETTAGETYTIARSTTIPELKFAGASISLQDDLTVNYKVDKALFEEAGYTNPYVVFTLNGITTKISQYTVSGDRYVFSFRNIAPNQMNDTISATLYATYNGTEYASATRDYSVAEYCYSMLDQCVSDDYAELRTLLVDLLHYGAASQSYTGYKTDDFVNAELTAEQLAWGTSGDPTLTSALNTKYKEVENATAVWKGAGLYLQEAVVIRLKFTAESIDGLSVLAQCGDNAWRISASEFVADGNVYYVYFNGLDAGQMRESVYFTIYNGDTAVSNTVCYSIESYAYEKQNSTIAGLSDLMKAMIRYGDAAYAYVN